MKVKSKSKLKTKLIVNIVGAILSDTPTNIIKGFYCNDCKILYKFENNKFTPKRNSKCSSCEQLSNEYKAQVRGDK